MIDMLANQRSVFPSEAERVGESAGGLVVREGEWGDKPVEGKVKEVEEG